ncbi:MAG: aminotransferase class V-fold PLP-dependent enzyme [Silicimonas sp.]|nr:aminotransferase class V-fold PLP-dependent enzyme [Silicimonas sp.]
MRFASDNAGPVHPAVMDALVQANQGWALPYGNEDITERACARVRDVFEAPEAAVYFVATGTAANALALATLTRPFDAIFCTPEAHIEEDECNAPEFYTGGAKLTLVDSHHGLMRADALTSAIGKLGSLHGPQPGAVSITQVTERGTLYTLDQIAELARIAHNANMPLHLDGARFANACSVLGCTAAEMSWKAGVDAVSFGGTKNGLMGVEAVILFNPEKAWQFELRRKRGGHLFSKKRFLAAQMDAYLTDGLWLDMAAQANAAAAKLTAGLKQIDRVRFDHAPQANMLYVSFPRADHQRLHNDGAQYDCKGTLDGPPDEMIGARLVCDWSMPDHLIQQFLDHFDG